MKMRKALIAMIGMMLLMVMTVSQSCTPVVSRDTDHILTVAEELMESSPDSVLVLLSDPALRPGTDRQKALYALLLTQARHKNYIDETNDSLIATAVDYFDRKDDGQRLMKSLFYHATINSNAANYPAAMTSAMRAKQLAEKNEDIYWQARIAELTGTILFKNYCYEEATKHYETATRLYKDLGIENAYLYNLGHLAVCNQNMHNYELAIVLSDSVKKQTNSPYIKTYSATIASESLCELGRYDQAEKYADTIIKYSDIVSLTCQNYANIANIKLEIGETENAKLLLEKALQKASTLNDTLFHDMILLHLYNKTNDISKAYTTLQQLLTKQNYIAKKIRQQSSVVAQRDYFSQETIKAQHLAERRKNIILYCVTIAIFAIIISFIYYRYNIQRKRAVIDQQLASILSLSERINTIPDLNSQLSAKDEENNKLNYLVQQLLADRLTNINNLLNDYYNSSDSTKSQLIFYRNMENEIRRLTDKKNLSDIERLVNQCHDDIVTKMRRQLQNLNDDDITFLALVLGGYETRAISLFTGLKPNTVYSKRRRLIAKIGTSTAPDRDWFISQIEKPFIK